MALPRKLNPALEKLRNEVDGPPNLDTLINNAQKLTSRIHSAYLFENEGMQLLQHICLFMSSTASGKIYSGWQEFASHLGLTREQILCIEYDFKGLQDPTYYVLLSFIQSPEATIDKILIAFKSISRLDVINRINDELTTFANSLKVKSATQDIIKPRSIPRVPLVLQPLSTERNSISIRPDPLKYSKPTGNSYGSIVMMTFTRDGMQIAQKIAQIFRGKNPRIGVLMLQEQEKHVYRRAEEFIDDCFNQVNYIVPILTSDYVKYLNDAHDCKPVENCLDVKYVKYVYSLLRYEYVQNKCCNNRVRCIVPESEIGIIMQAKLHPTLQAWFREADIDAFAENVLLKKF